MKSRLLYYYYILSCHVAFVAARPSSSSFRDQKQQEMAEILVTNRNILEEDRGEKSTKLIGSFSTVGTNYETGGDIVQVSSFRACDARRKGLDHTVFEHVSVVFVDDVQPFLTGCVALDNQARFAEKSGAMALVVGPASRVEKTLRPQFSAQSQAKIPIIVLNDTETEKLRQLLDVTQGSMIKLRINFATPEKSVKILKLQVFRPTLLNICLIGLLLVLVIFVSLLVVIKIRCQPSMHRELWLRALARTALAKMEIRNFSKEKKSSGSSSKKTQRSRTLQKLASGSNSSYFAVFGSLTSVAASSSNSQERCVICLEEYEEGTELRVLFCGHEFHPKCVDPWLLSRRRCPLCQFDVVYKHYPIVDEGEKVESIPISNDDTSSLLPPRISPPNPPQIFLQNESEMNRNRVRLTRNLQVQAQAQQFPRRVPRARSCPRRRQLRSRNQLEFRNRLGGYSSDVSSSHFEQCL